MEKKNFDFKKFLKTYYRKIILYTANLVAFVFLLAWSFKVYRVEGGGSGYGIMGPLVSQLILYLRFAFFSLIVYYLSIIAGAFTNMYKERKSEKKEKTEKEKIKSE